MLPTFWRLGAPGTRAAAPALVRDRAPRRGRALDAQLAWGAAS